MQTKINKRKIIAAIIMSIIYASLFTVFSTCHLPAWLGFIVGELIGKYENMLFNRIYRGRNDEDKDD